MFVLLLVLFLSADASINWGACTMDDQHLGATQSPLDEAYKTYISFHTNLARESNTMMTGTLQCADLFVPVVPGDNSTLKGIKVIRFALNPAPNKMVWHFAGGPGESSTQIFGPYLDAFATNYNADVYVMDIRGIGTNNWGFNYQGDLSESTSHSQLKVVWDRLTKEYKNLLPNIKTDADCSDIREVITNEDRSSSQKIMLVGHSYGTFLVHRFVQLYPDLADSAILDSALVGPEGTLLDWSLNTQKWYSMMSELCAHDYFCHRKFGDSPDEFMKKLWDKLSDGVHCSSVTKAMGGVNTLKFMMTLGWTTPDRFQLAWLFMYRLNRCDDSDTTFLNFLVAAFRPQDYIPAYLSPKLYPPTSLVSYHMRSSELGRFPIPTMDYLQEQMMKGPLGETDPFLSGTLYGTKNESKFWPWTTSPFDGTYANSTKTQFFILSGQLDFNTPAYVAPVIASHLPNATLVVVKGAGHVAGLSNLCGNYILTRWLVNGGSLTEADRMCLSSQSGPDWMISPVYAQALGYFWFQDLYETSLAPKALLYIFIGGGIGFVLLTIVFSVVVVRVCRRTEPEEAPLILNDPTMV